MFFTLVIIIGVIWFFLSKTAVIVPTRLACVKERLGKFNAVLEPGFHVLIPFVDRIHYRHEMREQVFDVPPQSCITRDNIQVKVDGLVYIKVMDPVKASYGIENYALAAINLAQTTMRSEIGKLTLDNSFHQREALNQSVVAEIDKAADPWGIKVLRYEIMNITPSDHVIHTLEKQMEAERERRADVTIATAQKEAVSTISEGERLEMINVSQGERQRRINEAEGKAMAITIVAEATAEGVARVGQAIQQPGGAEAVKMRIVDQYLQEMGRVIQSANVDVVPVELANIKGFFEGVGRVSTNIAGQG
ncbi:MAG: paraslipin [Acidobacteria bacterium]|nr:paraslipin [Acidobacteriota bacterium]